MKIFNTMTKTKEEFVPTGDVVKIYACGITASGDAHIGHGKQAYVFDIIRNYLKYKGYSVKYIRNYTDVDDKIIANAPKEGLTALEFAKKYLTRISNDIKALGVNEADAEPKATETIPEIIEFVNALIEKGYAYVSEQNGDVYFDVEKDNGYGKLSKRKLDDSLDGSRKDSTLEGKHNSQDFTLWKLAKEGEPSWDSPWGKGRPGWHIECSAMCYKYLGETVDIHGGGLDLKFPHHENEIAQSEARFNKPFAKYWVHCGLIKVNGSKMSKSLGNGITIRDVLNKYNSEVVKFLLLQSNYKSDMNIIDGDFEIAEMHLYSFYKLLDKLNNLNLPSQTESSLATDIKNEFIQAMDDDFNTTKAIGNLFTFCSQIGLIINTPKKHNELCGVYNAIMQTYNKVFNIFKYEPQKYIAEIKDKYLKKLNINVNEINNLIAKRAEYKAQKNYDKADEIKNEIISRGLLLSDTPSGTTFDIDFEKLIK